MNKQISFLFAALLLITSCTDVRYDYLMEDTVYFPKSDLQEETLYVMNSNDYVYNVWIHKAGYFQTKFVGKTELDYNFLVQYNINNSTDYEMLDQKYYSFDGDFVIEAGSDEVAVPVKLNTELLLREKGYRTYYIPLSVNSRTPGEEVNVEKSHFILALDIKKPGLMIDGTEGEQRGEIVLDLSQSNAEYEIDMTAKLDINTTEELVVTYGYQASEDNLLTAEELPHLLTTGFEYASSVKMAVGSKYAENKLKLKPSTMADGKWILPVRMSTTNDKVGLDPATNWLKLTVIKGSLDKRIPLKGSYVQGNEIILSSEDTPSGEEIADISEFTDMSVSVTGKKGEVNPAWLQVGKQNGKLMISVTGKNDLIYEERIATIKLKDNNTWLEKEITVKQGMKGCGMILNKSLWSIVGFSDNVADKASTFGKLFDNFWPAAKAEVGSGASASYIEVPKGSESEPVQIIIDLGETPHAYNSIGIMPRIQWTGNSPKYAKIEVCDAMNTAITRSDDNLNWILVGEAKRDAFVNIPVGEDLYKEKIVIKWLDLGKNMNYRYIRLSLWDTLFSTICLDEVFVTQK